MSLDDDAKVLLAKQQAGADFAITQFFFNANDYFRLVQRAAEIGVDIPILPGIMPVTNVSQITRFAQLSGAEFPTHLAERFTALGDDPEAVIDLGVEVAAEMCQTLLDNDAPGLHFYTLNRSNSALQVFRELGLDAR
jgi:methylenetetrahydrofolate reductase (NADPH)